MLQVLLTQPFEQFEIFIVALSNKTSSINFIAGTSYFITNFVHYLIFIILLTSLIGINFSTKQTIFKKLNSAVTYKLISSKSQLLVERFYIFIFELVYQQVGFLGQTFVPLFFSLFSFILFANIVGLVPYSFTLTSHIMLSFTLSFSVFIGLTLLAIFYQPNFFELFIPKGVPSALVPFLFVIEIISYVSRTFSLAIRLFANMMSGHVLLHILTGFCAFLFSDFYGIVGKIIFFIPFILIVAIIGLEFGIAFLQAYVFCVLISIYLCDVFTLGH
jgi:ATP synthase subunit 6